MNSSRTPDGAYVTDILTAPERNPWNRRVRFGGLDFFSDDDRILVFNGTSVSILVDSDADQCLCGDDASVNVDLDLENPEQSCVTNSQLDCIWLDDYFNY